MALDLGKLREKYNSKSQGNLVIDRWQPKEGENSIRILPHSTAYFKGTVDEFVYPYFLHYNVGAEKKTAAVCPRSGGANTKCPICEASSALYKGDDKDKELASDLYHKRRFLTNILDLNDIQKGVQVYEFGPTVYNKLMKYVASGLFGDILDLEKGRNVILSKTVPGGQVKLTDYELMVSPDISSIVKALPADYMTKIDDLGKLVPKAKSYDELKALLEGEDAPAASTASVQQPQTQTQTPPPATPPASEKPICYGKEFSLKSAKCRACTVFEVCKKEFIRLIDEGN